MIQVIASYMSHEGYRVEKCNQDTHTLYIDGVIKGREICEGHSFTQEAR